MCKFWIFHLFPQVRWVWCPFSWIWAHVFTIGDHKRWSHNNTTALDRWGCILGHEHFLFFFLFIPQGWLLFTSPLNFLPKLYWFALGVFADCKLVCVFQSFWVLWWSSEVTAVKSGNMYAYIPENVPDLNSFSSPCKRFSAQPREPAHLPAHGCFLGMNSTTDFDNPSAFHISLMYLCYLFFDLMFFHWRSHLFTYYIDKQLNLTLNDRSQIWAHSCTGNISI